MKRIVQVCLGVLVLAGLGAGAWYYYTTTEKYKLGRRMAEADALAQQGKLGQSARIYQDLLNTASRDVARTRLRDLVDNATDDLSEIAGLYEVVVDLHRQNEHIVTDPYQQAMSLVNKYQDQDTKGAELILESIFPLATRQEEHLKHRRKLLERLIQQAPQDLDLISRTTVVYEILGDQEKCEKLLLPVEAKLEGRDGAAVLGRVLMRKGKWDDAHRILLNYCKLRQPLLTEAEDRMQQAQEALKNRYDLLSSNKASGFNYKRFQEVNKNEQDTMVAQFIAQESAALQQAMRRLQTQTEVVRSTLDLGMVQLLRAQKLQDQARKKELEAAEKTFLSVRTLASKSSEYNLRLGQVYYWLGRHAEGEKLFDEILVKSNRASADLIQVSRTYRDLGQESTSRKLSEEAYNKAKDQEEKHNAALFRSLSPIDLDDKILWLSRANNKDMDIRATLNHSRGEQAEQTGQYEQAEQYYKTALEIYAKMGNSTATLNNSALVHFSMFNLTQDPEQFQRGLSRLEQAIRQQPDDSILLGNGASFVKQAAAREVIGDKVNWKALKRTADLDLLNHLYSDSKGRDQVNAQLIKHPGFNKAQSFAQQLLLLAPKRAYSYRLRQSLHFIQRDAEGLAELHNRLKKIEVDLEEYYVESKKQFAGEKEAKEIEDFKKSLQRSQEALNRSRKVGGLTLAIAASRHAQSLSGTISLGLPTDTNQIVSLAEEAEKAASSSATRSARIQAHLCRAHDTLQKTNPEYAALAKKTRRSLSHSLLYYTLCQEGSLGDKARELPDVKTAAQLELEQINAFPEHQSPLDWVLLRTHHPEEAAQVAKSVQANLLQQNRFALDQILTPLSGPIALEAYLRQRIAGRDAEANATLAEYKKKGVPLP